VNARSFPVLMLHGQPGGGRDWGRVVVELGEHAEPIAVDRPGWDGHSRALDLEGNALAALAALDARDMERAVIAGHSLGAAIAAWLAAHHPARVQALVLAAPAANRASIEPVDRLLAGPLTGEMMTAASLTGLGLALSLRPVRRRIASRWALPDRYLNAAGRALLTGWAHRAFLTEQRWLVRDLPDLERTLPRITAPTTILTGAHDWIVPAQAPRALADQIPGARLVVLDRVGHLLPQLSAPRVAEAIRSALPDPATD